MHEIANIIKKNNANENHEATYNYIADLMKPNITFKEIFHTRN